MEIKRRKFQGVLNILSFNRHFYVYGLAILFAISGSLWIIQWPPYLYEITLIAFIYGLTMPLIISAYVYDFSGYYNFNWLEKMNLINNNKINIVNINAGFDETSFIIKSKYPNGDLKVYDFYDQKRHTEPAIIRARKVSLTYPNTQQIAANKIPLETNTIDLVFLLSAAHEIRSHQEKVVFLKECNRICKKDGKIIMVEHLRDFPNFLAFTIGVPHFFSKAAWKKAFLAANIDRFNEIKFTPFMSIFTGEQK